MSILSRDFRDLAWALSDRDAGLKAKSADFGPQSQFAISPVRVWWIVR